MKFVDRLDAAQAQTRTPALIGIDPHLDLLPEEFAVARDPQADRAQRAQAMQRFCCELLDLLPGKVSIVKPQSAFFEVLGADGVAAFEKVVEHAHRLELMVIGDVKRNDIASTASAYAHAFLGDQEHHCDAITVTPYLGPDTLVPFTEVCGETDAGLYVLVRTSNPGSGSFQLHGTPPLWSVIAEEVERAGEELIGECGYSSVGAVVGATHASELAEIRAAMPRTPFLLPGYGAQGAGAKDIVPAFVDAAHPWRGGLVNSSRGIAFAWRKATGSHWKDASSKALEHMLKDLDQALQIKR